MISLEKRFKLPPNIVIKRKGEKYLFLNSTKPDWIVTNSNGAIALKLCNGKRTLKEIINILSNFTPKDVSGEIQHFFSEISKSTFFSYSNGKSSDCSPYNLRTIHLNLTNKCNLKCIYCYAEERSDTKDSLCFKDYLNIIDSINNVTKNVNIVLTGGEPLLEDYCLDLAEYATKKGNQVQLLTNGVLINKENVKRMADTFNLIKISIDGSTPEIHNFHRGNNSFETASNAVEVLIKNNAHVEISMTVTKRNISDIENMANKFGSLLSFAPLFKAGRARAMRNLGIKGREYYEALSSVSGVNPMSYLCSSLERAKGNKNVNCGMGDAEISISHTGNVYPCHLLHIPQFLAGNVKEQSSESIYQTSDMLIACRKLTVLEINGCKKCEIRFICGGACRARAFFEKNRIDVSDDFCEYEKQAFINGLFELHYFD